MEVKLTDPFHIDQISPGQGEIFPTPRLRPRCDMSRMHPGVSLEPPCIPFEIDGPLPPAPVRTFAYPRRRYCTHHRGRSK